jgi:hypothetical protein
MSLHVRLRCLEARWLQPNRWAVFAGWPPPNPRILFGDDPACDEVAGAGSLPALWLVLSRHLHDHLRLAQSRTVLQVCIRKWMTGLNACKGRATVKSRCGAMGGTARGADLVKGWCPAERGGR